MMKKISTSGNMVVLLVFLAIMSKFFGMIKESILAYGFGTSGIADVYSLVFSSIYILFGWLNVVSIAYTPIFIGIKEKENPGEAKKYTDGLISVFLILTIVFIGISIIFSNLIVKIIAPGLSPELQSTLNNLFRTSVWMSVFMITGGIIQAYLECEKKFIQSELANLANSICQMGMLSLSIIFGERVLGYVFPTAYLVYMIVAAVFARVQLGYEYKFNLRITTHIKHTFYMMVPLFFNSFVAQINLYVDRAFASLLETGAISAMHYANIIRNFFQLITSTMMAKVLYPILSDAVVHNDIGRIKYILNKGTKLLILICLPISAGAVLLSKNIVAIVFQRGSFDEESLQHTQVIFCATIIFLVFVAVLDIITKVFYSLQYNRVVMVLGIVTVAINIILNILWIKPWGVLGLTVSSGIALAVVLPIYYIYLKRRIGNLYLKSVFITLFKSSISVGMMSCAVITIKKIGGFQGIDFFSTILELLVCAIGGAIVYFVMLALLRENELAYLMRKLIQRRTENEN